MSINQIIIVIFIFVIFLTCFFAILITKKKHKLNEVQIKAQNLAYKIAFIFSFFYNILLFILNVLNIQIASFKMTRPQKVRPKKSNFGGRYFYVKIQL